MSDSPTTNINPEYTQEGFGATSDQTKIVSSSNSVQGMLDQTLGQVLQNNPQAQQTIIQAMGITAEQFEQMRGQAQGSQMMDMTIRELIENGTVQQAVAGESEATQPQILQSTSFLDKIKSWFK